MDEATRAERILGDAIGRHIIEAIDAGFQPPLYVAYVSVSGAAGVGRMSRRGSRTASSSVNRRDGNWPCPSASC